MANWSRESVPLLHVHNRCPSVGRRYKMGFKLTEEEKKELKEFPLWQRPFRYLIGIMRDEGFK